MTRDQVAAFMLDNGGDIDAVYKLVAKAIKQEREECLNDIRIERDCWTRGRNDMGVMVCDYITQSIIKRGMA